MLSKIVSFILYTLAILLFALPFAIGGGLVFVSQTYALPPESKANDVRLVIARLKKMASVIEDFQKSNGRLPTMNEIHCDLKPCIGPAISSFQNFRARADGTFSLSYHSLGVPFTPVSPFTVTYQSQGGTTDYDGWDKPWRWHLRRAAWISFGILIIAVPWVIALMNYRATRKQISPA